MTFKISKNKVKIIFGLDRFQNRKQLVQVFDFLTPAHWALYFSKIMFLMFLALIDDSIM